MNYFNYDYNYNNIYSNLRGINILNKKPKIRKINGNENIIESLTIAGNIHKNVRYDIQRMLRPGVSIYDISKTINNKIREYTNNTGVNGGIAFPPVLSVNDCIAHFSPTKKQDVILSFDDNIKIDFGVHVNGYIIDSAFTCYFNNKHDDIHKCCKEALYEGIRNVGIDAYINDISSSIEEVVNSYGFKIIKNVGGHNIERFNIHAGMFISNYSNGNKQRMKKGIYAIEPFITYKSEYSFEGKENNNYRIKRKNGKLYETFNDFIFTDTHIDYYNLNDEFKKEKNIKNYPSLYIKNDIGVQYEHTIYVDDNQKIVMSQYDDY
jgi:methionyl aminopeptidase